MSKIICPTCGPTEAKIDGSQVMEHAFEGVYFKVTSAKKGVKVSFFDADKNDDYFSDFNMPKLFKELAEIAAEGEYLECTKCGEEITLNNVSPKSSTAIVVSLNAPKDLFGQLFGDQ